MEPFRFMLAEGKPNSLGRTIEVVETALAEPTRIEELFGCWTPDHEWVRMRAANGMKRVFAAEPHRFDEYCEQLLSEITQVDQPSAKWTLSHLWLEHRKRMTPEQLRAASDWMIDTLHNQDDWIVLNMTMKTLRTFAKHDETILPRIEMRVRMLADDCRKSVASVARKLLNAMGLSLL